MRWYFALMLIGILASGCKSQAPTTDPFFGRTTIPPPPTGSVTGCPAADPGYQSPPTATSAPTAPTGTAAPLAPSVQLPSQPAATSSTSATPTPTPIPSLAPSAAPPGAPSAAPRGTTAPSGNTGNNSLPGISPSVLAPRPTSTMPSNTATPSTTAPGSANPPAGSTSPYQSSSGTYNYRGTPTSSSAAVGTWNTRTAGPTFTNVAATRVGAPGDDRMPKPVDDAANSGGIAGQKPIVRTIQPRGRDDVSDNVVDITDLPKSQ